MRVILMCQFLRLISLLGSILEAELLQIPPNVFLCCVVIPLPYCESPECLNSKYLLTVCGEAFRNPISQSQAGTRDVS